jgi:hypothetical protein
VKNSTHLIHDLNDIPITPDLKLVSFDNCNMYPNITTNTLPQILSIMCWQQNTPSPIQQEILAITELILKQNYFRHQDTLHIQNEGLAMGAPTSSIFSETFLHVQYLEDSQIFNILLHHQVVGYFRYVDDILLLVKPTTTDTKELLRDFNNISPTIKFTMEKELENNIKFLDLSITRLQNQLTYSIHRKPTTTDAIVPSSSYHPIQHKLSTIRYLTNRRDTY